MGGIGKQKGEKLNGAIHLPNFGIGRLLLLDATRGDKDMTVFVYVAMGTVDIPKLPIG
jgi:hypothetical protein